MTQNLEASQLSLNDVRRLLKLEKQTGRERSILLAQVLKAICKLQNVQLQLA